MVRVFFPLVAVFALCAAAVAAPPPQAGANAGAADQAATAQARAAELARRAEVARRAAQQAQGDLAALAGRVQRSERRLAAARAETRLAERRLAAIERELARERAPMARLVGGIETLSRRPATLMMFQNGSLDDMVHARAVIGSAAPTLARRTAGLRSRLVTQAARRNVARAAARREAGERQALEGQRRTLMARAEVERLRAERAAADAGRGSAAAVRLARRARTLGGLAGALEPKNAAATNAEAEARFAYPAAAKWRAVRGQPGVRAEPAGQAQVTAPGAGEIVFAGPYRGYGTVVIIAHPGGWTSTITGLSVSQVATGQPVIAGSPLGLAPSEAPVLSWELRRAGTAVDPRRHIRR